MIATTFFVMGIATMLNSTLGIRLPIIQGATASLVLPVLSIAKELGKCPELGANETVDNYTIHNIYPRIQLISGTIMCGSTIQILIGLSGAVTIMLRFIGPLVIAPTITLIGLSLFKIAAAKAQGQWWIALTTSFLIFVFTYFLSRLKVPVCVRRNGECGVKRMAIFKTFPVFLGVAVSWGICGILTVTNVLPSDKNAWGYAARTDASMSVITSTPWFQFPYPGQWGPPQVFGIGILGLCAGFITSIVESVGDYVACARLSEAPSPPIFAVNRGLAIEGLSCFIAGALGLPVGTTSFSENVAAIGITRVGSRRVVQVAAIFMLLFGVIGKAGAIFVTIPDPIYGGIFITMFAMLSGVGLSNLQFVNMNSPRNLFVVGTALFMGLVIPEWMATNGSSLNTGSSMLNDVLRILLNIHMFVGGVLAFILDLLLPGTDEDRGIKKWRSMAESTETNSKSQEILDTYDLGIFTRIFRRFSTLRYLPICPTYSKYSLEKDSVPHQNTTPDRNTTV